MMKTKHRRCGLLMTLMLAVSAAGHAEQSLEAIKDPIPEQPVAAALSALSRQTGLQIVYMSKVTDGIRSTAIPAGLSPQQALRQLLNATGLAYEFLNERTVTILAQDGKAAGRPAISQLQPAAGERFHVAQADPSNPEPAPSAQLSEQEDNQQDAVSRKDRTATPEILVKGRRSLNTDIRRTEDDAQPYVVFDADDIARSGVTNVEEFLKTRLPMNTQNHAIDQLTLAVGNAGRITLRGLDADETLILVDGHRIPSVGLEAVGFGQPNINGIAPTSIERIEILPATSGGIYGGSATAGVINIILKRNYSGLDVQASYGNAFDTDVGRSEISLSGGFALEDGRTRVMLSASHAEQNGLLQADRDFWRRAWELSFRNNPVTFPGFFSPRAGYTTNYCSGGEFACTGEPLVLDDGTAIGGWSAHVPVGYAGPASDGGAGLAAGGGQFNLDPPANTLSLLQAVETKSAALSLRRDFSERLEGFLDLAADRSRNPAIGVNGTVVNIAADSPNNPFQQAITALVSVPNFPSAAARKMENRHARGGFILRLPRDWTSSLEYSWGKAISSSGNTLGFTLSDAGNAYLETVALGDLNAFPADLAGYIAFRNPLTGPYETSLGDAILRFSGPALKMPAGPVALSGYLERRKEEVADGFSDYLFDPALPVIWNPRKSQTVRSLYLEARLPLARQLELMTAVRRDEYASRTVDNGVSYAVASRSGPFPAISHVTNKVESTDYTLGVRYTPVADVTLRASFGTGFLPPNLEQISPFISVFPAEFLGLTDPLRGDASLVGDTTFIGGGNSNLVPEQSESLSYGIVFTPRALAGLRVSIDCTRIEKSDEIASFVPQQYFIDNEDRFPGRIVRGPNLDSDPPGWAGPIVQIDASGLNIAAAKVEAYDFQVDYELDAGRFGTWRPYLIATRQTQLERQFFPQDAPFDTVGFFDGPLKWRGNFGANWSSGAWTAGWNAQYFGSYSMRYGDPDRVNAGNRAVADQGGSAIPDQIYQDIFLTYGFDKGTQRRYAVFSGTEIALGIQNVLNDSPPIVAARASSSFLYSTYADPRLRRFTLTLRKNFGS